MIGIGVDLGELAVFDGSDHAAARRAHGAVGVNFFGDDLKVLLERSFSRKACPEQRRRGAKTPSSDFCFCYLCGLAPWRENNFHRNSFRIISFTSTSRWLKSTSVISSLCCFKIFPYRESMSSRIGTRPYWLITSWPSLVSSHSAKSLAANGCGGLRSEE